MVTAELSNKRVKVLEHLYRGSDLKEEQERVKNAYEKAGLLRSDFNKERFEEEWRFVETYHLVPTMGIILNLAQGCKAKGITLYCGHYSNCSYLLRLLDIDDVIPTDKEKESVAWKIFYLHMYKHGPSFSCDAENLLDVQDVFTDCFMPCHIYLERAHSPGREDENTVFAHPASFFVVPFNDDVHQISPTTDTYDYVMQIHKDIYPPARHISCVLEDFEHIQDRVWSFHLFAHIIHNDK